MKKEIKAYKKFEKAGKKEREAQERRRELAKPLLVRRDKVIGVVAELTKDAEEQTCFDRELRKKIVAVIGDHPISDSTENHKALCGVTLIKRPNIVSGSERADSITAEFAFAVVPSSQVEHLTANPHDLHDPSRQGRILFPPEECLTEKSIITMANIGSLFIFGAGLGEARRNIAQSEGNLAMVLEAIADPTLNPHLQAVVGNEQVA